MLAFCMHTLDLFKHRIVYFTTAKVSVKLFIGKSHFAFIGPVSYTHLTLPTT
mgnify:CR=1 FL=1